MSIVKRHDVVQTSLVMTDRKQRVAELEKGKSSWSEFSWQERNELLKELHTTEINAVRQHANLAVDHQKMLKAEFYDTWTATVGAAKQAVLKVNKKVFNGKHLNLKIVTEDGESDDSDKDQAEYVTYINATPTSINGFQALKKKWQYFKINKVSVSFVSNSANNLSPIVCRYMPPMGKEGDVAKLNADYVTKYAESVGTTSGFMSIHCPPCLVKKGEFDKNGEFKYGENGYCLPGLNKDRMLCSYEDDKFYLDYGTFIFESKNIGTTQNIIAKFHYVIDFYSGYDYDSASILDGGDDNGDDTPSGDDDDGEEPGDEGNTNVPDSYPSDGPQPKGSCSISFRRGKRTN